MEIGTRELKYRLSEILHLAKSGEKITITMHGEPICEITPVNKAIKKLPAYLESAIQSGLVSPAKSSKRADVTPIKSKKSGASTTKLLMDSRQMQKRG
ncbi:MAG: Antitoxin Phd YefM, type toxin-antitoxin system [Actinomycetota bacterium]|jgi:prevent-host-death family protein